MPPHPKLSVKFRGALARLRPSGRRPRPLRRRRGLPRGALVRDEVPAEQVPADARVVERPQPAELDTLTRDVNQINERAAKRASADADLVEEPPFSAALPRAAGYLSHQVRIKMEAYSREYRDHTYCRLNPSAVATAALGQRVSARMLGDVMAISRCVEVRGGVYVQNSILIRTWCER